MTVDEREFDLVSEIVSKLRMGGPNAAEITDKAADTINRLRTALAASEAKLLNVRQILAGTDVGSLPNDYPIERLALETWNTLQERTLEGLALIGRAEAAEAKLEKAGEALKPFAVNAGMIQEGVDLIVSPKFMDDLRRAATTLKDIA